MATVNAMPMMTYLAINKPPITVDWQWYVLISIGIITIVIILLAILVFKRW